MWVAFSGQSWGGSKMLGTDSVGIYWQRWWRYWYAEKSA